MPQALEEWDEWVPVDEAARLSGLKAERLRLYCRKGKVACKKLAGVWLIRRDELGRLSGEV